MAHSQEKKAAVMAALLAGQGVNEVAAEYDIPKSTVSGWKRSLGESELNRIEQKKSNDLGVMIGDYLTTLLETLTAQARVAGDPEWIRQQPADELGVLHGILADKGFRLLGAIQQAAGAGGDEPSAD